MVSGDIAAASAAEPVTLQLTGTVAAGDDAGRAKVVSGSAFRILTGAALPAGATAVLAQEFAEQCGSQVVIHADSPPGKNILKKGSDIACGQLLLPAGARLDPAALGLAAAAGCGELLCHPLPRVAVVATGSELVWPGEIPGTGKVAASNMVIAAAELRAFGIQAETHLLCDHLDDLQERMADILARVDLLITCGGVLDGDKDFTMQAMERLGLDPIFQRVRIGPGKGACFGSIGGTVVFNLPGGPPSHHVALILLALPGVRRLMGCPHFLPAKIEVSVEEHLVGQKDWTQLVYARVTSEGNRLVAQPLQRHPRLFAMAAGNVLIEIPEGVAAIAGGALAEAWRYGQEEQRPYRS